jgi:hypothetical protein
VYFQRRAEERLVKIRHLLYISQAMPQELRPLQELPVHARLRSAVCFCSG